MGEQTDPPCPRVHASLPRRGGVVRYRQNNPRISKKRRPITCTRSLYSRVAPHCIHKNTTPTRPNGALRRRACRGPRGSGASCSTEDGLSAPARHPHGEECRMGGAHISSGTTASSPGPGERRRHQTGEVKPARSAHSPRCRDQSAPSSMLFGSICAVAALGPMTAPLTSTAV